MADLVSIRRAYASDIMRKAGVTSPRLEAAYASVSREAFLGPPPWSLISLRGVEITHDPARLYADVLVALKPERGLNNGEPSGHALWIASADPGPGEHVVHVGAGTGYYTAILSEMVGRRGRVTAVEFESDLAEKAARNLASWPQARVLNGDGTRPIFDMADVIYVNAAASHPAAAWLDGLTEGGRLVAPLTADSGGWTTSSGAVFRFTRRGETYEAAFVSPTAFYPCEGGREPAQAEALAQAFARGGANSVKRLVRSDAGDAPDVWLHTPTWSLLTSA